MAARGPPSKGRPDMLICVLFHSSRRDENSYLIWRHFSKKQQQQQKQSFIFPVYYIYYLVVTIKFLFLKSSLQMEVTFT